MALKRSPFWGTWVFYLAMPILLSSLAGCAEIQIRTLPPPPPTAKLRVFIKPITGESSDFHPWDIPHEQFENNVLQMSGRILRIQGIYKVVPREDVQSVLGGNRDFSRHDWSKRDWALAREVGRALHADYALFVERSRNRKFLFWDLVMIGVESGRQFRSLVRIPITHGTDYHKMFTAAYRNIFWEAKGDMLATAVRKSRVSSGADPAKAEPKEIKESKAPPPSPAAEKPKSPDSGKVPPVPAPSSPAPSSSRMAMPPAKEKPSAARPTPAPSPTPMAKPSTPTAGKPAPSESQTLPEKPGTSIDLEQIIKAEASTAGKTRLAVYDLNTSEPFKIIVQILSEALREEIFRMGAFSLVNRENMDQVLNEMGLQQTGLVEEGQAVRAGKGLAAAQIVLGQFGVLGSTSMLQVKRIDVETQGTLAVGSLRCSHGREEELLAGLSDLARKLAGGK
jgi:hypothetical protein